MNIERLRGLHQRLASIRDRLPAVSVAGRPGTRVVGAALGLALFLIATCWLVTPAPRVSDGFLWFVALSTACELVLWVAIVLVTGRPWASAALFALLATATIVTNNIKYRYTGVAALPVDVYAAAGVMSNLGIFLGYIGYHVKEALALVAGVGLAVAAFWFERPLFPWPGRVIAARVVGLALIGAFFYPMTSREAPVHRLFAAAGASFDGNQPNDSVVTMGLFAHIVAAAPEFFPTLPTSDGDAELFRERYREMVRGAQTTDSGDRPDIVVVLSESLFDPRSLRVRIEPDPLATLDALGREAAFHGFLRVATIGGGTVRAEYSVLTGIPTTVLGQGGQWPFYSLVTESTWSLAKYLRSLGYRTVAVYPVSGSLFNARQAYERLGFSQLLDLTAFDVDRDFGDHYVKDEAVARKIIDVLEASDQPTFVFALTMETHGPWSFREYTGSRRYRVQGDLREDDLDVLDAYVHRLPNVEALATTVRDHLEGKGRPYVFGLFGDHLPAMFDVFDRVGFRDDGPWDSPRFLTPYVVLTDEDATAESQERNVDVSFLGSMVLDAAGLNRDEFFGMSSAYREFCGGSFLSCRAGEDYRTGYLQVIYDSLRQRLGADRATGAIAARELAPAYTLGDVVRPGSDHFGAGWSLEPTRMWSVEPSAHVTLRLAAPPKAPLVLAVRAQVAESVTRADILVNDRPVETWDATPRGVHERFVEIPRDVVADDVVIRVEFRVAGATAPSEAGTGWDTRPLGVAISGLRVCEAKPCAVPE